MELKKRESIKNVNFNSKGEKIQNAVFEDDKKKDADKLGKEAEFTDEGLKAKVKKEADGIVAAPGENEKKQVSVSKTPDSSIPIANGSPLEDHEQKAKMAKLRKVFIFGGIFAFILLLIGGYYGLELKDVYLKKVPLESVLKGGGQVVLNLNSNTDFEQYKHLDNNLRKFPGYKLIEKELDDVGEGKTLSQAFQDELQKHNLSFDEDIKPVLGEKTLVVIPTVTPITNELQKMAFGVGKKARNELRKRELDGKFANAKDAIAAGEMAEASRVKVLGLTSDFYAEGATEQDKAEPVDFVIGASIKSLKEAKRVLDKIKSDTNKYEVSEIKFEGYRYYKITRKLGDDDLNEMLTSIKDTYHALIGQNWVMSTKEEDLKEMISARKAKHTLTKMAFWKKPAATMATLAQDGDYRAVERDLVVKSQKSLLSVYLKVSTDILNLPADNSGSNQSGQIFKMQGQNLLLGFLIRVTPDGIVLRSASNQFNLSGVDNTPIETGLIQKVPRRVASRWTDFYTETSDVKNIYYNFKKNNLTKDGINAINEMRTGLREAFGVDFDIESDFIDHFNGNLAFAGFTSRGMAPHASIIAEIDDKERMLDSIRKMVEISKRIQAMSYQMMLPVSEPGELDQPFDQNVSMPEMPMFPPELRQVYEERIKAIMESQLVEIQTEIGPIYQYKIAGVDNFSVNCAFVDNVMMLGTDQVVVTELVKEFGTGNATKLTKEEDFARIANNIYPEGYSKSFIKPLGIWHAVSYFIEQLTAPMDAPVVSGEREMISAFGTVFKTINAIAGIETTSPTTEGGTFAKSAVYIDIKEVSKEEKEYAERILEKL